MITHLMINMCSKLNSYFRFGEKNWLFFLFDCSNLKAERKISLHTKFLPHTIHVRICLLSQNRVLKTELNTKTFRIWRRRKWLNASYIVLSLALVYASTFVTTFFYNSVYFRYWRRFCMGELIESLCAVWIFSFEIWLNDKGTFISPEIKMNRPVAKQNCFSCDWNMQFILQSDWSNEIQFNRKSILSELTNAIIRGTHPIQWIFNEYLSTVNYFYETTLWISNIHL